MTGKRPHHLLDRTRINDGKGFRLKRHDPADTGGVDHAKAPALLADGVARLAKLQELFYADHRHALLVVFQAMDAAGKDGTISHVMSGVNPQGVQVHSFKQPSAEERAHDFLWRGTLHLPARGEIGIFNRSHYEDVLITRVHPDLLAPRKPDGKFWKHRLQDIEAYERHLAREGTTILKFFLHISPEEQKRRLLDRLNEPDKHWKFDAGDLAERDRWDDYMAAYEAAIRATATKHAPWFVVPADHKWFARVVVVEAMIAALEGLHLRTPAVTAEQRRQIDAARRELEDG